LAWFLFVVEAEITISRCRFAWKVSIWPSGLLGD
jgi:hypothetical protein